MAIKPIKTVREQVYCILKKAICEGDFKAGERLQEIELAEKLNVSRSPIREALRRIVGDGLAIEIPNKGVFVKKFSSKDIDEIFEFRVMLECYAINNAQESLTEEQEDNLRKLLKGLEAAYKENDLDTYTSVDAKLHAAIMDLSKNELIKNTYHQVNTMTSQFRILALAEEHRFAKSLEEHRNLVMEIVNHNPERAKEALIVHLTKAKKDIIKNMSE